MALCVFTLLGCSSATEPSQGQPLPIGRLATSLIPTAVSSFDQPQRLLIRDAAQWQSAWTEMWRGRNPIPPLPHVDFARDMVLIAAAGTRPTGGYSIHIEAVSEEASTLRVVVRTVAPGPNCIVTLALTQPADVVVAPRRDAAATFDERAETRSCS